MSLHAVKVLGISITKDSRKSILEYLRKYLISADKKQPVTLQIVTPNTEQVVFARRNPWFAKILNRADVALPDSIGIVWGSRIMGVKSLSGRIPGITFFEDLVALAAQQHVRTAFIGGRGGVAVEAFECLQEKHLGLEGWAEEAPEVRISVKGVNASKASMVFASDTSDASDTFDTYLRALAKRIVEDGTQIVFVALGPPKQELFMERLALSLRGNNSRHSGKRVFERIQNQTSDSGQARMTPGQGIILMAVGGSFDEISGRIPRAPQCIQAIGLKWLWRLILQPWRIRRQFALLEFIVLALKESMSKKLASKGEALRS